MSSFELFYNQFITNNGYQNVLKGLGATIEIAVLGLLIGIIIGTLIAVVKVCPKYKVFPKVLDGICTGYVALFRGTPMVVQLLIGYYVLFPLLGLNLPSVMVAVIIFGLNSGAYISEIMRSGIQSIDPGQLEASRALGMSYSKSMLSVIIPQSIKNILPTLGNEFIVLIKDTSIVSFIAVVDLTKAFRSIADANYEYIIPYCILALVYLVLVLLITLLIKLLERGMKKSER